MTQYSHSRLASFENCPKRFEYRYVQKLEVDTEGIEAFVGKRVHEILERLYHHVARHGRPPSLAQVKKRFIEDWALHWHEKIRVVRKENSADFYQQHGERCLENYYRSHYPFEDGETVALEKPISLQLDEDGRYRLRGIIDRLAKQAEGTYEIHDYKTGSWLPPLSRLDQDRQLALYQIGIEQTFPDIERVELVWHYLFFNKTLRSRRTPEQLDGLRSQTIQLIDEIEATNEYCAKPGSLCRWCDYSEICPHALLKTAADAAARDDDAIAAEPRLTAAGAGPASGSQATTSLLGSDGGVQLSLLK